MCTQLLLYSFIVITLTLTNFIAIVIIICYMLSRSFGRCSRVHPGATLEITLGQYWLSQGSCSARATLAFAGVDSSPSGVLAIDGAVNLATVDLAATIGTAKMKPSGKLDRLRIPLAPECEPIAPYDDLRDEKMPGDRTLHKLVLNYKINVTEAGEYTPRLPKLNNQVRTTVVCCNCLLTVYLIYFKFTTRLVGPAGDSEMDHHPIPLRAFMQV